MTTNEWRKDRKRRGLCINCGKNAPCKKSKNYCEDCRIKAVVDKRKLVANYKSLGLCACGRKLKDGFGSCERCFDSHKKGRLINRERYNAMEKARWKKLKDLVYNKYGGYKCTCCGETEKCFLSIDHINGGGGKHRKEIGLGGLYKWLIKNNFPSGYQVLCMNCQFGRKHNNGICPHKQKEAEDNTEVYILQEHPELEHAEFAMQ